MTRTAPVAEGTDTEITEPEIVRNGPHIPRNAKRPQDHKAPKKTAAQIEAEGIETVDIEWRDLTFTVPATPDDWPVVITLAFEEGKAATGVKGMLGREQWAELMKTKPRNRDLGELFDEIAAAVGLGDAGK